MTNDDRLGDEHESDLALEGRQHAALEAAIGRTRLISDLTRLFAEKQANLAALMNTLVGQVGRRLGDSAAVWLADDGGATTQAARWLADERRPESATFQDPVALRGVSELAATLLRRSEAVLVGQADDAALRRIFAPYGDQATRLLRDVETFISVPLRRAERAFGLIVVARYRGASALTEDDRQLLEIIADRASVALENARLMENARRREAHYHFLADAGRVLAETTSEADTIRAVARLSVTALCDLCAIARVGEDGLPKRFYLRHRDPEVTRRLRTLARDSGAVAEALMQGLGRATEPVVIDPFVPEMLAGLPRDPAALALLAAFDLRAVVVAPLRTRLGVIGVAVFATGDPDADPLWTQAALEFADRAALTIERTLAFQAENMAREDAEAAVRLRDEFIAVASHELRTPLTPLLLQIERALAKAESLPDTVADAPALQVALQTAERQVGRLNRLVTNLLDASRLSVATVDLELEDVSPADLSAECVRRARDAYPEVSISCSAQGGLALRCDPLRLDQVLTNLLTNACRYGKGAPVDVRVSGDAGRVRIAVSDAGPGIAPDFVPRLFKKYARAQGSERRSGLGLGLYIAKEIIERHGGRIDVRTAPSEGTTFTIDLPAG